MKHDTKTQANHQAMPYQRLRVWHQALEVAREVRESPVGSAAAQDQVTRAMKSVLANICEGSAFDGAMRRKHMRVARASMVEVVGLYEAAWALGECPRNETVLRTSTYLVAMLSKLIVRI